mmetsp:Transcript_10635/g.17747  ORF Transcript_10635/g.17747 Transcript_10635/m.17747 type:complete len:85 (+) Transcript_10635:4-258(+)
MPYSPKDKTRKNSTNLSVVAKALLSLIALAGLFLLFSRNGKSSSSVNQSKSMFHQLKAVNIDNEPVTFDQYVGKVVLVMNVASK